MRIRSSFAFAATTVLLVAACGGTTTTPVPATTTPTTPPAATTTPVTPPPATTKPVTPPPASTTPATTPPSAPATASAPPASTGPSFTAWKIGVVTDVGTVNDKNFNQYSYEGAKLGAHNIGAADPQFEVPASSNDYAPDIQNFVSQGYNLIVTVGFNLNTDTLNAAKANPSVWFIGVDQNACVDATGAPDSTFACAGDASKLLPNFVGLQYQEDQAGYLAGIVSGSISKNKNVAAIGGINSVPAVVRYIQGFQLGAMSVDPKMKVDIGYVSTSDFTVAFGNPGAGKDYADQFIATNKPDVVFQVAGNTGNGILESTCNNGLLGIGVDVDEWLSLGAASDAKYNCIVTSAEKHLSDSVAATIQQLYLQQPLGLDAFGSLHFNAANGGIGVAPEQDGKGLITPAIQTLLDTATAGMAAGTLTTCPTNCGSPQ